jgi:hypothetical protein
MVATTDEQLRTLSRKLQELHAHALDVVRELNPSVNAGTLLDRLVNDPQWAWLRALTALIADIDHVLAQKQGLSDADRAVAAAYARGMLYGEGDLTNAEFLDRYRPLLQMSPSLASMHGEVKGLLRNFPVEAENESERLHARHTWAMRCKHQAVPRAGLN